MRARVRREEGDDEGCWRFDLLDEPDPQTSCKHGSDDCGACGTSFRRDALHTTVGGRGAFARLRDGARPRRTRKGARR